MTIISIQIKLETLLRPLGPGLGLLGQDLCPQGQDWGSGAKIRGSGAEFLGTVAKIEVSGIKNRHLRPGLGALGSRLGDMGLGLEALGPISGQPGPGWLLWDRDWVL